MRFAYGYDPAEAATWRCSNRAEMGGPIGDVASHCFYMAEFVLGSRIKAVRATYFPKRMAIKVEDGALVQCDLENGVTVSALVSFCAEVAAAAAVHSVGRRVRARPGHILRVRRHGSTELLPRGMKVAEAGFKLTETVDIVWQAGEV